MSARTDTGFEAAAPLTEYRSILLAADSSDHANRGITEAVELAGLWNARITGTHVYAAKMHDMRFRQMEGGLPEQFRAEQELERQRDVHDDLITRGLSIITDSYLDQAALACEQAAIRFARRPLEGKNYRALVMEASSGDYDLLVLGALGLGAIPGSRLGSVCQRVVRRSKIDTLVIKDPQHRLQEGPIVVAIDGSAHAYGGLLTALALAQRWGVSVQVVAAFDPYYHYVAFNRIAGVLSAEAGKVFRFQEQEKLHEEIIDSGLAKIYQGHLGVATAMAAEYTMQVDTLLLDGKPHDAIEKHLRKVNPSLLVIGKLGIHADPELDIGGNAENLLRNVSCSVLLSQRQFRPRVELLADVTTSWTREAEIRMARVPDFVRNMARMAILRYAQERGHTVITERLVEEATAQLMPGYAERVMAEIVAAHDAGELKRPATDNNMDWSDEARALLLTVEDSSLRNNLGMRAEKKARTDGARQVAVEHVQGFIGDAAPPAPDGGNAVAPLHWQAAALARLMRVPQGFMRDTTRQRIEDHARNEGFTEITLEITEQGLATARNAMECPFAGFGATPESQPEGQAEPVLTEAARALLQNVPLGFCRDMTRKAATSIAARSGITEIDDAFMQQIMKTFEAGAQAAKETMPWDETARARIARAPETVRGMLVKEIEGWAKRNRLGAVTHQAVDAVKKAWRQRGAFHLDPDDPRSRQ